ncbi:2Fe-2S iron-sulfur cluster-binding protein [Robbsia andropogonis]|uniref:2Fe-2S iron-sulfur cluster-binding protein n=1 Tax=Robbsia andropogonis TaxID=28092 RepID=UPI0009DCE4FC
MIERSAASVSGGTIDSKAGEQAPPGHAQRSSASGVWLTVLPAGRTVPAARETTILAAAAREGMTLPSSCRNGSCRACLCRCVAGAVRYDIDWPGVTADERAQGWILPCIAYPDSDVTIDQPEMRKTADLPVRPVRSRGF